MDFWRFSKRIIFLFLTIPITCSVDKIISGPIAGTDVSCDIGDHVFVVIDTREWYFIKIRIGRYGKSFLKIVDISKTYAKQSEIKKNVYLVQKNDDNIFAFHDNSQLRFWRFYSCSLNRPENEENNPRTVSNVSTRILII